MLLEHYELIRLTVELIETYPYDKGNAVDCLELKSFELDTLVEDWEKYISNIDPQDLIDCGDADGVDEETKILIKVKKYLEEVKKNVKK